VKRGFIPVIEVEIAPADEADRERLLVALGEFAAADARFVFRTDESARIAVAGVDERELDQTLAALRNTRGIEIVMGPPQVAYRETITRKVTEDYSYKKQTDGTGQYARVKIVCVPLARGAGSHFESRIIGGNVPEEYIPGVDKGIKSVLGAGVIAGFPVVDVKATLVDGAYHEQDSSALAFEIASRAALREALMKADPVLLEPMLKVDIATPEEFADSIVRDLRPRRGTIRDRNASPDGRIAITAIVPAANILGYETSLRHLSRGRASYVVDFDHYAPIPPDPPFSPAVGLRA
jgi:elongation factor G